MNLTKYHYIISVIQRHVVRLLAALVLSLSAVTSVVASDISASLAEIHTLDYTVANDINIVTDSPQTNQTLVSGTINSNRPGGWILLVFSGNLGKLKRLAGGPASEITYTNIKLVHTGGAMGATMINPSGVETSVGYGGGMFYTGAATTATVDYQFQLQIGWEADTSLLTGHYTDTISLLMPAIH